MITNDRMDELIADGSSGGNALLRGMLSGGVEVGREFMFGIGKVTRWGGPRAGKLFKEVAQTKAVQAALKYPLALKAATGRAFRLNKLQGYNGVRFFEKIEQAGYSTILVKRTSDIWASIDSTRMLLRHAVIHARCSQKTLLPDMKEGYISGVDALSNYKMAPPGRNGVIRNEPLHDVFSHACDSLRTFADAQANGLISKEAGWRDDDSPRGRFSGLARGAEDIYSQSTE